MRLLITGATGFIGDQLVREALLRGHAVFALVRARDLRALALEAEGAELLCNDLQLDVIIHAAVSRSPLRAQHEQVTLHGTRKILSAAKTCSVQKVVCISSLVVLDFEKIAPMSLIDCEFPVCDRSATMSHYAAAKLEQEALFQEFRLTTGASCVILRPGLVYDAMQLSNAHAGVVKKKLGILFLHAGEVPMIDVRDLASAVLAATERINLQYSVFHLVEDSPPNQRAYHQVLGGRRLLPRIKFSIHWRLGVMLLRVMKFALERFVMLPEVFLPHAFSARLKPFRYSNARAKERLDWRPVHHLALRTKTT